MVRPMYRPGRPGWLDLCVRMSLISPVLHAEEIPDATQLRREYRGSRYEDFASAKYVIRAFTRRRE